jgi:hypothetical protein
MAEWYDEQYGDYYEPISAVDATDKVAEVLYGAGYEVDPHALALFEDAVFNSDEGAYRDLVDWMWDQYGIDFEEAFSWDDFREWYGSQ